MRHFGFRRYCPACRSRTRAFLTYGLPPRPDARCPVCGSAERERAQVLLLERKVLPALAERPRLRILHVAPEPGVARTLTALPGAEYVSGDITPGRALETTDLTKLRFADGSLDFVFVSHVLEHIEDDRRAIAEIFRALSPGGCAFVEVPVLARVTYEDPSLKSEAERLAAFGQVDHVRLCGLDYVERLLRAGFAVDPLWIDREFSAHEIELMRLRAEELPAAAEQCPRRERLHHVAWLCRKPA